MPSRLDRRSSAAVVVSGMIAGVPHHGGAAWAALQYVLGLRRLGHRTLFVEPVAAHALRPSGSSLARSQQAACFRDIVQCYGIDGSSALLLAGTEETIGLPYDRLRRLARDAEILVNLSGALRDDRLTSGIAARLYIDLDPVFTQLWHAVEGIDMGFDEHTHFFTVGTTLADSPVPSCGIEWLATLPPVVLDAWAPEREPPRHAFTTVGHWRSYGSIEYRGVHYGQRAHSFRRFVDLPRRTGAPFEPALAIHPTERADVAALEQAGWSLLDPVQVAATPDAYRRFVAGSTAEVAIAKSGYVLGESGWFSDRSACYLAAGRPVVAQDTGFTRTLPTGEGLLAFTDLDGAVTAVDAVRSDYDRHAAAANALAAAHLDSDKVLTKLLESAG